MTGRLRVACRRRRHAAAWIVVAAVCTCAAAQSVDDSTKLVGFPAGPLVIAPSLTTGYAYESNVYQQPDDLEPSPDRVLTLRPALLLTVPFSNSALRLGDTLSYVDYKRTSQTAGKSSNDAVADLTLNFASLDRLDLFARHIAGVAETLAFDPGGEVTFQGHAYRLHTERVSVSREVEGARGYRLSLDRNALRFDRSIDVSFVDYRGFEGEGAYLQPLSPNTRLAFGYVGTLYDQFDARPGFDSNVAFRTEGSDAAYAQIEGRLGPKQPYSVRVGWERLTFSRSAAKDFSGLVGQANLSAIVGGGTTFTVFALRQPYRSSVPSNNYYLFDQVGWRVERHFQRASIVGGHFSFSQNTYEEISAAESESPGIFRRDRTIRLEVYANLTVADRVVFRVSILKNRKYSNFPGADYNATVVFGGFVLGWI